jgi:hypothetical protein
MPTYQCCIKHRKNDYNAQGRKGIVKFDKRNHFWVLCDYRGYDRKCLALMDNHCNHDYNELDWCLFKYVDIRKV